MGIFLMLTSYETYRIKNVENIKNTTNHTNVENIKNTTNHTNVENGNHVDIVNVNTVKKYEEVKYLEFDLVYNQYVKKHNSIVFSKLLGSSAKPNISELPKVVVVQSDLTKGYGNRIPPLVCGFIYSLLSDRLFFIDGYDNFSSYYEKDFEHNWKIVENMYKNSSSRHLHKRNVYNDFQLVATGNLSNDKTDILYVATWDYACAPITSNPHYKEWFNKLIPDSRVFTAISLKLIRLHPNISKQVEIFADNNFKDYNIGIHLREKKTTNRLITPIDHFSEVVKMLILGMKNTNITIFVSADSNNGRKKLVNLLDEIIIYNNNSINIVHTDDNMDAPNPFNSNTGTEIGALIDMKLLSLCDDLVITYGSTFGYTAAGWSSKVSHRRGPYVVMPIKNSSDDFWTSDKVWVYGATSNEPCMYLSKWVLDKADKAISRTFKSNPLWMHYSQCHWPI
ncbi:22059_t:CDS:2 [Racocetra persica]|uniref:22059_t:CDS:1 n=1 Tax=Racocetra persica TaxID=160502 RepID=A0ACA9LUG3_9GLOM|nr:22059_t:CDS:2 [Racocetra persica]